MAQFLRSEPIEVTLNALIDALDHVDFGIVLLDNDLSIRFINRAFGEMWAFPDHLMQAGLQFRDLMMHAAVNDWYAMPDADLPAFIQEREADLRANAGVRRQIEYKNGRCVLYRCASSPNGGRILTYIDISQELQQEVAAAEERISADARFNAETMESQASYLASLAETSEENAQSAEAARRLLENEIAERRQLEAKLRHLATRDGLTETLNRAGVLAAAQSVVEAVRQSSQDLAVIMLDVDHFKAINDHFGHAGGDQALQHLAALLRAGLRQDDLLGRMGGEEFLIILPGTSPNTAGIIAERLRSRVAETALPFGNRSIEMTVSMGITRWQQADASIEAIIARADAALYRAKGGGRNRVESDLQAEAA